MIDFARLFQDYHVPYSREGKNVAPGHINIQCPCCDDPSNHGGFNVFTGKYACWRCKGAHPSIVLSRVLHVNAEDVASILREYSDGALIPAFQREELAPPRSTPFVPPGGPLNKHHIDYLQGRNFRASLLQEEHHILGTGPSCEWEGHDFRLRIIIPIYTPQGDLVNFQGRDITGKQELRYKGCPIKEAVIHHKKLLYGAEQCRDMQRIVVCEGVFDQWRLGRGAVATFGTSLKAEQLAMLSLWPEIVFLFDPEPEAQAHARQYAHDLAACGRQVEIACADFGRDAGGNVIDPGDLNPADAKEIMADLLSK